MDLKYCGFQYQDLSENSGRRRSVAARPTGRLYGIV